MLTSNRIAAFEAAARPLIQWLAENMHPHATAIVNSNSAELVEGLHAVKTDEYLQD